MWTEKRISDLGKIITGSTPSTDNPLFWGEDIPFISPSDFDNDDPFVSRTERYLSTVGARTFFTLPRETVLTTCIGSLGKMALTQFEQAVCNQQINALICNDENDPRFIFYAIKSNINKLKTLSGATTIPIVNKTSFGKITLKVPEKGIQSEIANILDTLDTQIRQTEAIIAKLQQVKQGLLHDLLTRGIDANGQLRPPRDQAPELYKESPLGWIPRVWEVTNIRGLATNLDGRRIPIRGSERKIGDYPYYGASGIIDWVDNYIFDGDYALLGEDGENVVSRNMPLAFRATGKIWVNNHAHIYSPHEDVDVRFLVEVLENKDYRPFVSGSAQPKLTQANLLNVLFVKPPLQEQAMIVKTLSEHDRRACQEKKVAEKLKKQKSGLMDDLLTGRVRVTSLLDTAKAS